MKQQHNDYYRLVFVHDLYLNQNLQQLVCPLINGRKVRLISTGTFCEFAILNLAFDVRPTITYRN